MLFKKLRWTIKRHPFLYLTRFRLLSKNSDESAIASISYNTFNHQKDIPDYFNEINAKIFPHGKPDADLELVKQIVIWLFNNTKVGPGLSEPSDKALETMLYGKGGVCSDMAQIFNNFCVINNLQVREWGTTSAPFSRENGGHSFNEVYINEFNKWVLVDPSWGMLFYNDQNQPLSVIELYELSRTNQNLSFRSFIEGKIIEIDHVMKNYLNTDVTPFLICDYRNKTYDRYLKITRPFIPVFVVHFMVYILGKSYHYKFPIDDYKKIFT
ncbi:transglutaminase-like domain-containing protein [Winogradskyella bathintestinalis]|uniref:Transglutaminase-like domain-containing protein n=1 Tax=Winogradskyella bathintestinalis TaxID=3035208 RepID=A0ABT7ZTS7_9FLAO|nr:transglutaminase-like domain-containing protein [Winogradskyella bathintestinalis]MDN3492408.1 transglutaminase-like domain-containing protein [Winogradskyella bathintestinalis]